MPEIWLIADTHFYHGNIIKYCGRPEDHNERMWEALESLVKPEDTLIHLGDVAFVRPSSRDRIVERLPGAKKILIEGNHDKRGKMRQAAGWHLVLSPAKQPLFLGADGVPVLLTHRPMPIPEGWKGIIVHGHTHERGIHKTWLGSCMYVNASVEQTDYRPLRLRDLTAEWKEMYDRPKEG